MSTENLLLVPALRFPEFEGKWEQKKLGDVVIKVGSGSTPLGGESAYVDEGIIFIRSQNVKDNQLSLEDVVFISEETNAKMKGSTVNPSDILLNITGASLGRSCVVPDSFSVGNVNQHVCIIRLDQNQNSYFLQALLSSERGQKLMVEGQTGSGREGLNFQSIRAFKFTFPTLPEQKRIASFFTILDQKLNQLKQKKNLLAQYKKGVMQQLFLQEWRFKNDDGNEFPEWESKKLGEVADIKKGEQLNKEDLTEVGDYPCINGGIFPSGYTDKFNSKENTITISEGGNSCGYINFFTSRFWSGGHCYTLKITNPTKALNIFLYHMLKNNEPEIMKLRVGSGLPNIQKKDLIVFSISLPSSIAEQTKIANFLSAIDEKINQTQTQIGKTEQYKKGLLQKMFC